MNLAVTEGLKRYVNDVFLKFFNGFSLILEGKLSNQAYIEVKCL